MRLYWKHPLMDIFGNIEVDDLASKDEDVIYEADKILIEAVMAEGKRISSSKEADL